jgi:hypothetical protein
MRAQEEVEEYKHVSPATASLRIRPGKQIIAKLQIMTIKPSFLKNLQSGKSQRAEQAFFRKQRVIQHKALNNM